MAVPDSIRVTLEEFEEYINRPENVDRLFEYIGGEIVEVPSNAYASEIGYNIGFPIKLFLRDNNIAGHVTGEAGGYMVFGERYAPDVAYISSARQPELAKEGYNPIPPELAVEIDFPSTYKTQEELRIKVANYLNAGTMVWVVRPEQKLVEVYVPGKGMKKVGIDGVLDGGDVLPGFKLPVRDIFPE